VRLGAGLLLPVDDGQPVLFAEQLVEHLAEPEQFAMVDADGEHAGGLEQ
jgi:hypothetical protein